MKNSKPKIFIVFVVAVFSFLFGWQGASIYGDVSNYRPRVDLTTTTPSPATPFAPILDSLSMAGIDLSLFWEVWQTLDEKYIHEDALDEEFMVYGAVKGMVNSLDDPFTIYLDPRETDEFKDSLNGSLHGVGAELTVRDYNLVVVSPLKNSPAEKAGLKSGDIVYKVDGEIASEMTLYQAIMSIRGESGTEVVLSIMRDGVEDPFDISIIREQIDLESVSMEDLSDGIFLVSINQFSDDTKSELSEKLSKILLAEPKGLVMDLRYNGGGYLDISVDILSEFLSDQKEVVTMKRKKENDTEKVFVYGNPRIPDLPLIVLINEGSASASEIVAGAIQDHDRGVIMGEQSFGKGTVQEVETFSDGSSLRLTIAEWFTPAGRSIDGVGITPDIIVGFDDEGDFDDDYDPQLDEAVRYLQNL
jgi:carboxyl-terminal processing protease